jgi:hypothetical protein
VSNAQSTLAAFGTSGAHRKRTYNAVLTKSSLHHVDIRGWVLRMRIVVILASNVESLEVVQQLLQRHLQHTIAIVKQWKTTKVEALDKHVRL